MPDEDIMDQLREIGNDDILGKEISIDTDLDFEGLDDMDNEPTTVSAPAIAPPAPRAGVDSSDAKPKKPAVKKPSRLKSSKPKVAAAPPSSGESEPPTLDNKIAPPNNVMPPVQTNASVTEVDEVVVKAKTLRIIADKVIIEPGDNISFS